jgi:LysM repeat protein
MILRRLVLPAALGLLAPFIFVSAVSAAVKHTVTGGDTLSLIAQIYEKSVAEIAGHNGILNPDLIFPGQEIEIPGENGSTGGGGAGTYVVQPGDTLSGIAARRDVTTSALQSANGISDADYIYAGQVLTVPSAHTAPAAPKLTFPARPVDGSLEAMIDEIAYMEGVEPGLVKAIATVESGWSQWAISHAGAIGIMQVMPGTVWWLETEVFGFDFNEYESAWDNVRLGARYLRILLDETGGDYYNAVSAYYQGLTPTQAGVYYPDTADYASMVLSVKAAYWP